MLRAFLMPAHRISCSIVTLWGTIWKATIEDADEMNVDQAYRLTLLELNVFDTDDTENT